MSGVDEILVGYDGLRAGQEAFYKDLHTHPELSHAEHRTAGRVAAWLQDCGFTVQAGIGGTGVVGVLANGSGSPMPTATRCRWTMPAATTCIWPAWPAWPS
jgi:metal-dependent amidase/aminoacylase/carboxypeptidase family protein